MKYTEQNIFFLSTGVGPIMLAFFLFVVVGSAVLQIIAQAQKGMPGM